MKHTVKVAVAVVLSLGIPISNHLGVKINPPPKPKNPPIKPAKRAALLVAEAFSSSNYSPYFLKSNPC